MSKRWYFFLLLFLSWGLYAQDEGLPPDFRQHNLTEYNSSLLSPIFSLDRNQPRSLALWTRWQWQTIDGDPTTLLFNYTHQFNRESAAGIGFFQHNTGLFLETGAVLNYAHSFDIGGGSSIALGLNSFLYQRKPADEIYQQNPNFPLPQFDVSNEFILQMAPSIRFKYEQFSIGIVGENLIDYNFSTNEQESKGSDKIILGLMSYQFPVYIFGSSDESYIQPTLYLKTLPGMDDQFGLTGLFSTPRFWAQLGYNTFYGASGGLGARFFKDFSIGALVEFGSQNSIDGSDSSIEFVTAYSFGAGDLRRKIVGFDVDEEEETVAISPDVEVSEEEKVDEATEAEARAAKQKALALEEQKQDSLRAAREQQALAAADRQKEENQRARRKRERDSIVAAQEFEALRAQRLMDSIADARREEALAVARKQEEDRKRDSISRAEQIAREAAEKLAATEEVTPRKGEKYEETTTVDGLVPGYYLIANVFGTKKYYEAFMKTLDSRGLAPKSFYRSVNKYNYVYLQRYDTIDAARNARDSNFGGKYTEDLWIFRVVPD